MASLLSLMAAATALSAPATSLLVVGVEDHAGEYRTYVGLQRENSGDLIELPGQLWLPDGNNWTETGFADRAHRRLFSHGVTEKPIQVTLSARSDILHLTSGLIGIGQGDSRQTYRWPDDTLAEVPLSWLAQGMTCTQRGTLLARAEPFPLEEWSYVWEDGSLHALLWAGADAEGKAGRKAVMSGSLSRESASRDDRMRSDLKMIGDQIIDFASSRYLVSVITPEGVTLYGREGEGLGAKLASLPAKVKRIVSVQSERTRPDALARQIPHLKPLLPQPNP